jgi:hypothetical protein
VTTCQGCAAELPEDVRYCPRCGLAAGAEPPELPRWRREPIAEQSAPSWSNRPPEGLEDDNEELLAGTERPNRRRRALITAGVALVAVVVAVAYGLTHVGGGGTGGGTAPLAVAGPGVLGTAAVPTPTTLSSATGPIRPLNLVGVAPAVPDSPALDAARSLLNRYFLAINAHNQYRVWQATLVPKPGRGTAEDYRGYRTTEDTDISITQLRQGQNGQVRVSVNFTSRQDPKLGNGHPCLRWWISFSLRPYQNALRIDVNGISRINLQAC